MKFFSRSRSSGAASGGIKRLSLLGALAWFVASYGVSIAGFVVLNAVASRLLGTSEFGYFVVALTTSTVIGQLGLIGVHRGGLREAANLSDDDIAAMQRLRGGVRAVALVTLPLASVLAGGGVFLLNAGQSQDTRLAVAIGIALLVWFGGQQKLVGNYLRGFGDIRMASLLEGRSGGALVVGCQALMLLALWLWWPETGLGGALIVTALGFAPPLLIARRRLSRRWRHAGGERSLLHDLRMVLRRDWRFAVNQLAAYLNSTVEVWLAAIILTSVQTSLFSSAQRMCLLMVIPLASVQTVFAPVCVRLLARGEKRQLEHVLRTGASMAAVVTAFLWIPMLAIPGVLLSLLFGTEFADAAPALVLLTIGSIANVMCGLSGTALTMSHQEGAVATVQSVTVAIRIVVGTLAALLGGMVGLALSAGLITSAMYLVMWWQARSRLGLRCEPTLHPRLQLLRRTAG